MSSGILVNVSKKLYTFRFYLLLFGLLVNFFIPPLTFFPFIKVFFKLLTTAILLLTGANFIQQDKNHLRNLWFIFGLINICVAIFSELNPELIYLEYARYFLLFLFFVVITVNLLQQIFSIEKVTLDVIIGSFCGYLLIGIICFFLFAILDYTNTDSYSGLSNDINLRIPQIFYFTFTCLTTLGFGDILATNMLSQKLAVLTASIGQFYIAVVVAILVSRFMKSAQEKNEIN